MAYINKKDTNGTKPLLTEGELGYDKYVAGGDVGRVYVGTGSENIALAKKSEVDNKVDKVTSTDNAVVRFDGATGQVQNSSVVIDDSGNLIAPTGIFTEQRDDTGVAGVVIDFPNYQGTDGRIISRDTNTSAYKNLQIGALNTSFVNGGFERMRIDSAGNVGIGVTPSAWGSSVRAIELSSRSALFELYGDTVLSNNAYYTGTGWIRKTANACSMYEMVNGTHCWSNTPSGTAGNTTTWTNAMTLDANGNLGLGTSSPTIGKMVIVSDDGNSLTLSDDTGNNSSNLSFGIGTQNAYLAQIKSIYTSGTFGGNLTFHTNAGADGTNPTERMRINSNGNLLVGTTTDNGVDKLQVNGSISASGIKTDGYFEIGKDYEFGDYTGIQYTRNPASMLVMVAGNDVTGAGKSALYLVNLRVLYGNKTTSSIRIAGDSDISATFTYVDTDIFRVTSTSTAIAYSWRYLGGYC